MLLSTILCVWALFSALDGILFMWLFVGLFGAMTVLFLDLMLVN